MNSENSKTSKPYVLILNLTYKIDLRRGKKRIALLSLSVYYTQTNIKSLYNNNKFKISAPTRTGNFELPDGTCFTSDIQDYFEYILKEHGKKIYSLSIRSYVDKIENRITFKIKTGYYLELLTPETMKLFRSIENKITKDKYGENVPHLENKSRIQNKLKLSN